MSDEAESAKSLMSSYTASENGGTGSANDSAASFKVSFLSTLHLAFPGLVVCNAIDCEEEVS